MLAAQLFKVGHAQDSVKVIEVPTPKITRSKELLVEIMACPINPAEILLIEGKYANIPKPPLGLGIEGAGIVRDIGDQVTDFRVGDKVMCLGRQNWSQFVCSGETDFIKLPHSIELDQASMLKVNVATSYLILTEYEKLSEGDWVIQNASNSGVGVDIIKIANTMGINVVSVARRDNVLGDLVKAGSKIAFTDDEDLPFKIEKNLKGKKIKLGIDAVAGRSTERITKCISKSGTVVIYGLLSGAPCQIDPHHLIFRNIKAQGFWLSNFLSKMTYTKKIEMYNKLAQYLLTKNIDTKIAATYSLSDINQALKHAKEDARQGKILINPSNQVST